MRQTGLVWIIFIIGITSIKAQTFSSNPFNEYYFQYQKLADDHYGKKEYQLAAENYNKAFRSNDNKSMTKDNYSLAGCWAMLGYPDSAFQQLDRIANNRYQKYNGLVLNQDLAPLHNDPRWKDHLLRIRSNRVKYNPQLNMLLVETLDTILRNDQQYRLVQPSVEASFGKNSKEVKDLNKLIVENDSVNAIKINQVLKTYGWPSTEIITQEGSDAIFLVIQHSDLSFQEKYLPYVVQAVQQKNIPASYQALLEDRIAISKGQKQKYGTQVGTDKNGKYYVEPIQDPENVDSRRASIGLGPLAEYLKDWNIDWPKKK
jgi:hypothetical protein